MCRVREFAPYQIQSPPRNSGCLPHTFWRRTKSLSQVILNNLLPCSEMAVGNSLAKRSSMIFLILFSLLIHLLHCEVIPLPIIHSRTFKIKEFLGVFQEGFVFFLCDCNGFFGHIVRLAEFYSNIKLPLTFSEDPRGCHQYNSGIASL